jgi:beta-glucosidase/6-phospho-beta-glucosidase/beta-galactosidase
MARIPRRFMFATGVENSCPTIRLPDGRTHRVDLMETTGHYKHWKEDFRIIREIGLEYVRYGPPYYKVHQGPGKYDWSFADETFNALKEMEITPIVDLCHFGVPDWIGNFQNEEWPQLFAEYAKAFARRYDWCRLYTPVNEIFITAMFSGQYGWWNERLASDRAFVRALKNCCSATDRAMRAILEVKEDATFIQAESTEYFHAEDPGCQHLAAFYNEKRFLSLDLLYGYPVTATMYEYLLDNGMTREEYHWFANNQFRALCIMGNDYYRTNEHVVHADGTTSPAGEVFGYYVITEQYYHRYHLPVMHTETNLPVVEEAPHWLRKQWANMHRLKMDGVPICGFTWYGVVDHVDWDTALREVNGHVNEVGLADLDRRIRPVGRAFRTLIEQWRDILPTASLGLRMMY